jgi:hypothetical protein
MLGGKGESWSAEEKLAALLEYERLSEEERGKYLRGKGLHDAHLERWKKEILEGLKFKPLPVARTTRSANGSRCWKRSCAAKRRRWRRLRRFWC